MITTVFRCLADLYLMTEAIADSDRVVIMIDIENNRSELFDLFCLCLCVDFVEGIPNAAFPMNRNLAGFYNDAIIENEGLEMS